MARKNEAFEGKVLEVVTEGFDRYAECYFGRTARDVPDIDPKVFFTADKRPAVGEYVQVRIDSAMGCDLIGARV